MALTCRGPLALSATELRCAARGILAYGRAVTSAMRIRRPPSQILLAMRLICDPQSGESCMFLFLMFSNENDLELQDSG
ncbi:MAG TPA: hypothetical protein DCL44_12175 [Elusimicrobia bacterium]|nr:hypothetical protein [Elusimicrobiota bacterium]